MLRITKLADYGFVLLIHMAQARPGKTHNARDLAAEAQLPQPMVSKILKALVKSELLVSHRGTKGGYALARAADQISAADVVTALDGPIRVTECLGKEPSPCEHEAGCPVKPSWHRINEAIASALSEISLAEMALPGQCCSHHASPATSNRSKADEPARSEAMRG